jgi:hypothetical protein
MQTVTLEELRRKTIPKTSDRVAELPANDRRLLLRATLGLFLKRVNHNIPIFRDDLYRLADCAEERPTVPSGERT